MIPLGKPKFRSFDGKKFQLKYVEFNKPTANHKKAQLKNSGYRYARVVKVDRKIKNLKTGKKRLVTAWWVYARR